MDHRGVLANGDMTKVNMNPEQKEALFAKYHRPADKEELFSVAAA